MPTPAAWYEAAQAALERERNPEPPMSDDTGEPRTGVIRQALELARSIAITGEPWSEQAGRAWLSAQDALDAIEREAAAAAEPRPDRALDVERLQRCPSLMVLLNRYGRFNGAWWDRLADEYAVARPESSPNEEVDIS